MKVLSFNTAEHINIENAHPFDHTRGNLNLLMTDYDIKDNTTCAYITCTYIACAYVACAYVACAYIAYAYVARTVKRINNDPLVGQDMARDLTDSMHSLEWDRVKMDEEEMDLIAVDCIAGILEDPKQLSHIIPMVNKQFPLDTWNLDHLKRIKRHQENILVLLFPSSHQRTQNLFDKTQIIKVPKFPAYTRNQFERQSSLWPTTFHLNQRVPKELNEEQSKMARECFVRNFDFDCMKGNCAIVVDDNFNVKAKSFEESQEPLGHACMRVIDLVARTEKAKRINDNASQNSFQPRASQNYLCTGNSLFVWKEPCVMCSMALVHSRIQRVFFFQENPSCGGLLSKVKIGYLKSLNHHFIAYQLKRIL